MVLAEIPNSDPLRSMRASRPTNTPPTSIPDFHPMSDQCGKECQISAQNWHLRSIPGEYTSKSVPSEAGFRRINRDIDLPAKDA
jgi:hypothetical protein